MTSDEIKTSNTLDSQYFWIWLKEIAYQLAVMNERNDVPKLKHNPVGEALGSTVPPDSESALREKLQHGLNRIEELARDVEELETSGSAVAVALRRLSDIAFDLAMHLKGSSAGGPRTPDLAAQPDSTPKESL